MIFSDNYILDTDAHSQLSPSSIDQDADEPSFDLSSHSPSTDFPPADSTDSHSPSSYHRMTLNSRPYLCSIPTVSSTQNTTNTTVDPTAEAAELTRATDRGWELLKGMEGNCMYFISGWWSYSFCYNTAVKQFHSLPPGKGGAPIFPPTEDPATPSYVLGKYDPNTQSARRPPQQLDAGGPEAPTSDSSSPSSSSTKEKEKAKARTSGLRTAGSTRYLTQTLTSGTNCDLTSRPRRIEVQYHCHPQSADRIGWIKEVSTCAYLMGVYTPRLCNDIAFLPPRENKAHGILCKEIISQDNDGVQEYEDRKREERARKIVSANPAGRPIVAGIEVGGMKEVGKEGQRLEPPAQIAPQPTNAKTDLLARQESKEKGGRVYKLPDKAIKALGVDPKLVEEAVRELRGVAGGKPWRLEVFDGAMGGRELRGVVDDEEDGGGGGEVEFFVVGGEDEYEDQGEDGDPRGRKDGIRDEGDEGEEGSEEVYKDEL